MRGLFASVFSGEKNLRANNSFCLHQGKAFAIVQSSAAHNAERDMVKNSKQSWEVGQQVRVGFLSLTVIASLEATGDGLPGAYILTNGTRLFSFVPHNGLSKITDDKAVEMCEESKRIAAARAAHAHQQVARVAANAAVCAKLQAIAA